MTVDGTDLSMTRGDSEEIVVNLSGYTLQQGDMVEMTVRLSAMSQKVMYKKVTSFANNQAVISIEPKDTEPLSFGDYVYDIQLTYDGGKVKTIVTPSTFTVLEEVTYG